MNLPNSSTTRFYKKGGRFKSKSRFKLLSFFNLFRFPKSKQRKTSTIVFTKSSSSVHKKSFVQSRTRKFFVQLLRFLLITVVLVFAVLFLLDFTFFIKNRKGLGMSLKIYNYFANIHKRTEKSELVKGLEKYKVLSYPGSEYVFKDASWLSDDYKTQIRLFLLHNNSIYLLKPGKTFLDIKDDYVKMIEKQGFKFVGYKPITDEKGYSGLYFVKDDIGLHVYTVTNFDIWYEIISKKQAESYLQARILNIISKQVAVNKETENLPKEYKIALTLPKGYSYEGLKLPDLGAYLVRIFDKDKRLVLMIVPYKKIFLEPNKTDFEKYVLDYLSGRGIVMNIATGFEKRYEYIPDIFGKQQVNLLDLEQVLKQTESKFDFENYKKLKVFSLEYSDVNGKKHKVISVWKNNVVWIIDSSF